MVSNWLNWINMFLLSVSRQILQFLKAYFFVKCVQIRRPSFIWHQSCVLALVLLKLNFLPQILPIINTFNELFSTLRLRLLPTVQQLINCSTPLSVLKRAGLQWLQNGTPIKSYRKCILVQRISPTLKL